MGKGNFIIALCIAGLGFWVTIDSFRLGIQTLSDPGAGLFPFLLGIALCFLSIPICISSLKNLKTRPKIGMDHEIGAEPQQNMKNIIAITSFLTGYFLLLDILGYFITTFFFMAGLFWIGYPRKWFFILASSFGAVSISYLIFDVLLQISFPSGLLR